MLINCHALARLLQCANCAPVARCGIFPITNHTYTPRIVSEPINMLDTYSVHCVSVITAGFRTATQQLNSTQLVEKKSSARGPFSGKRLGRESAIRDETLKDHLNLLLASSSSTLLIERRKVTRQPASHSRTQQQLAI